MNGSELSLEGFLVAATAFTFLLLLGTAASHAQHEIKWDVHDPDRPQPEVVAPPTPSIQSQAGKPPSDATILFAGKNLSAWEARNGDEPGWKVENGYAEVVPGSGSIVTNEEFGDVQLHIEWRSPTPPEGNGQGRGNSGVFFMNRYEVQILDSYQNETYPDGQAAAIYGQYPPQVNVCRPPGEWQSYDIIFHRPHFDDEGELKEPARMTVFHNGVLVHDNVPLTGPTAHTARPPYEPHAAALPIRLQDHNNRVRFRNIWVRRLE